MSETTRYLLALYALEDRASGPVAPGDLAAAVDRSPSATTEMLQRLEERGLVAHEPYEGASLTADGRETAEELSDTYRTLARFFDEVLGLDDYDEEAMRLAGTVSPAVADRLAATLLPGSSSDSESSPPGSLVDGG